MVAVMSFAAGYGTVAPEETTFTVGPVISGRP